MTDNELETEMCEMNYIVNMKAQGNGKWFITDGLRAFLGDKWDVDRIRNMESSSEMRMYIHLRWIEQGGK